MNTNFLFSRFSIMTSATAVDLHPLLQPIVFGHRYSLCLRLRSSKSNSSKLIAALRFPYLFRLRLDGSKDGSFQLLDECPHLPYHVPYWCFYIFFQVRSVTLSPSFSLYSSQRSSLLQKTRCSFRAHSICRVQPDPFSRLRHTIIRLILVKPAVLAPEASPSFQLLTQLFGNCFLVLLADSIQLFGSFHWQQTGS